MEDRRQNKSFDAHIDNLADGFDSLKHLTHYSSRSFVLRSMQSRIIIDLNIFGRSRLVGM